MDIDYANANRILENTFECNRHKFKQTVCILEGGVCTITTIGENNTFNRTALTDYFNGEGDAVAAIEQAVKSQRKEAEEYAMSTTPDVDKDAAIAAFLHSIGFKDTL
jgi:hypothetical protein